MDLSASAQVPRLNPFAFPSSTTFRFVLLIVAILGASAFIYDSLFFIYNAQSTLDALRQCQETAIAAYPTDSEAQSTAFNECKAPIDRSEALWTLAGMALLVLVAGIIFLGLPTWKIWRNRLEFISHEDAPEITAYLVQLCREMELAHTPVFLCAPFNGTAGGLVFGRLGRYYMVLNGGLVTQFYKDLGLFRTVVLHELAHLRNADVNKTYFSVAIWQAFVVAALFPFAVSLIFRPPGIGLADPAYYINLILRMIALTVLIYLTYKALLRVREMYADVRASIYDGPTGNLDRILATLQRHHVPRWRRLLQAHPNPDERRQVLTDTSGLFRLGFWETFGTGVIGTIAFSNVYFLLSYLAAGTQSSLWGLSGGEFAAYGAALIFMSMVAGVVVAGIWKEHFAALVRNAAPRGVSRLAFALTAGAVLGIFLSIDKALDSGLTTTTSAYGFNVVWVAVLLLYLLFVVHWIANVASARLEAAISAPAMRQVYTAIVFASALLLTLIGPIYLSYALGLPFAQQGDTALALLIGLLGGFMVSATYPFTIITFVSLWAYPLAGGQWRRSSPATVAASWVFLEPSPSGLRLPEREAVRIRSVLLTGLGGGVVWSLIIGVYALAGGGAPEFTQANSGQAADFIFQLFALAALGQAVVALVAAGRAKRLRSVFGLCAAFVADCCMTIGLVVLMLLLAGGQVEVGFSWTLFSNVIGMGTLLALPAVGILSAWVEWRDQARFAKKKQLSTA